MRRPMMTAACFRRQAGRAAAFALVLAAGGCVSVDLDRLLNPPLEEQTVLKARTWTSNRILLVDVSGVIAHDTGGSRPWHARCSPNRVRAILDRAARDSRVKAVVVRLNTPGGEASASDLIHRELLDFKRRTGIPVLASMLGLACSGGYYVAAAADRIYAQPTTVTGSIGVIARFPKLIELADKIGYREEIIASGKMKAMGHPLREMTPTEQKVLQEIIDTLYQRFLSVIVDSRDAYATAAALAPVADGRVFTAPQALELGLIDGIAYLPEVLEQARRAAGIADAAVVSYLSGANPDATIYSPGAQQRSRPLAKLDLGVFDPGLQPGFFYLWLPGEN